jgi:hypothetical protein
MNDWNSNKVDWGNYFTGDSVYYQGEILNAYVTSGVILLSMGLLLWFVWRK